MKTGSAKNQPSHQLGGFPCPRCKNLIQFPFQALLTLPSITCTQCGLVLQLDLQRSAAALEELRRYVAGIDDARRMLDENKLG
jgi:hypothetical protein